MRLRTPPITGNPPLDGYLQDVYQSMLMEIPPLAWWNQDNVSASQTDVDLNIVGLGSNTSVVLPYRGNIIGITIAANAARSAGTLTVKPVINGTESTTLSTTLDATNTQYNSAVQEHTQDSFDKRIPIGVSITTDGSWAPTTADIVVGLFVVPGVVED